MQHKEFLATSFASIADPLHELMRNCYLLQLTIHAAISDVEIKVI